MHLSTVRLLWVNRRRLVSETDRFRTWPFCLRTCITFSFLPTPCPSRVPHYSQRLKALYFIKTRDERLDETQPQIEDIMFACDELMTSKKLKKLLEVVLAFGNIMNRGSRGGAYGFKLSSLNKMMDTKSSGNRDMNLLHYIVKTLETQVSILEYTVR